jgi:hypothetical protein
MKKMFLMAAMALMMATAAEAQTTGELNDQLARSLEGLFDKEVQALRPDSVTPDGEWQKVIETQMKAAESYKYARSVLARMIPSYQRNVKLEDEKDCKIIVEAALPMLGAFYDEGTNLMKGVYDMTLTFVFKDGRYRVRCEAVKCTYLVKFMSATISSERGQIFRSANIKGNGSLQNDLRQKAGEFLKAFSKSLATQKSDDDF